MAERTPERDAAILKAARNIKSALAYANVSHGEAARRIGMERAKFSRRATGQVPFDAADIILLAAVAGVTPGHLLDGEPWPARKEERPAA